MTDANGIASGLSIGGYIYHVFEVVASDFTYLILKLN